MRCIDRFVTPCTALDSDSPAIQLRVRSTSAFLLFIGIFSMIMIVANFVAVAHGDLRLRQALVYVVCLLLACLYRLIVRKSSSEFYIASGVNLFLFILYMSVPPFLFSVVFECQYCIFSGVVAKTFFDILNYRLRNFCTSTHSIKQKISSGLTIASRPIFNACSRQLVSTKKKKEKEEQVVSTLRRNQIKFPPMVCDIESFFLDVDHE